MFSRTSSILIVSVMLIAIGVLKATADTEANKAIARRYMEEFWNKGDMDVADEIIDPEYIHYSAGVPDIVGLEEAKQSIAEARIAFPDLQWTVDDIFAEGDKVVGRETFRGTHQGEFLGIPPTGKQITFTGIAIARIAGGKLVEAQGNYDMLGMMQQLGVIPPTGNENYMWGEPSKVTGEPGDPEANKAIVRRIFDDVLNQRNLSLADEIYATNYVGHLPPNPEIRGSEGFKQFFAMQFAAFPDSHLTIEDMFAEGDKVVTRWSSTSTHQGELMGIPPTGKQVTMTGIVINRFADGKLVEDWENYDILGLMQQLTAPDTEANKAITRRFFEEVLNQRKLDVVDEIIANDYVAHSPPNPDVLGPEGLKQFVTIYRTAFPDVHYAIEDQAAEGDMVATRWTVTGTHQGELMGIPPTGVQGTATGLSIVRIASGKIVEEWVNWDTLGMMQQFGVIPPVGNENYTWGEPSEVTGDPGDPEENKAIMRDIVEEVINQKNLSLVDELYATDYVYHFPPNPDIRGKEGFKQYFTTAFAAFPDFHVTIEDMFAEGDKVVSRITARGTHQGDFMGIPPTGKPLQVTGIAIHRFASGKLVEDWENVDFLGMMQQLTARDTEANKAIARRVFEEVLNQRNLDLVDEIFAADYVGHVPPTPEIRGPEGFKQFSAMLSAGFPDDYYTIEDVIAEGDKVTIRWTSTGTHQGEFMGIPPTGNQITTAGITIYRIANGLIEEDWTNADFLGLFQQIGVAPPTSEDFSWGVPSEVTGDPGDPEENKAIGRRANEEALNQRNLDLVDEIYAADYVFHIAGMPDIRGAEEFKQLSVMYFAAFPDFHLTVEDIIAEGDKVVGRMTMRGTHKGEFMGIPPTEKKVTVTGILIQRYADGKIVEDWESFDFLGLMQQLGVIPSMMPKDFSNVFFMPLTPGLNMVSLPLEPRTPYTARSFAEYLSATTVIKLDEARQRFVGFTLDAPDDGFQIEGGKGYVVNVPEGGMVAFTGAAWTNQPPVEAASPTLAPTDGAWAFVVSGRLLDDSDDSIKKDGYLVTVRNTRTNAVATDVVRSRYFAAAFADLNRQNVVQTGDRLEVVVRNTAGEMVSDTLSYTVTEDAIRHAYLPLTLKNIEIPHKSLLLPNYPNPFNPETWIPYQLRESSEVVIRIYNAQGRLIRTLSFGQREAGFYLGRSRAAHWDGLNDSGELVSSGLYFYQLQAGDFNATRRMVIVK